MIVVFKGIKETRRTGCGCCGKARVSTGIRVHKQLSLPSGRFKVFRRGQETEVLDSDGEWLLERYGDAFVKSESGS